MPVFAALIDKAERFIQPDAKEPDGERGSCIEEMETSFFHKSGELQEAERMKRQKWDEARFWAAHNRFSTRMRRTRKKAPSFVVVSMCDLHMPRHVIKKESSL